ncbi:MAG: M15 family metallopeptidase [Bacteroidota bacterium]
MLVRSFVLMIMLTALWSCQSATSSPQEQEETSPPDSLLVMEAVPPPFDTVDIRFLLGKFDPAEESDFAKIPNEYAGGNAVGTYLHQEALAAFVKMHAAAKADGVNLTILSATRVFSYQKLIWESKWNGNRLVGGKNLAQTQPDFAQRASTILLFSSMPGTSRHHWGTDMDFNAFTNSYFEAGKGKQEYDWLVANGPRYGFCQPYTPKGTDRTSGYEEERWHWSYQPLAERYMKSYQALVTHDMIKGFAGAEVAEGLQVIPNYVFGVSKVCWQE